MLPLILSLPPIHSSFSSSSFWVHKIRQVVKITPPSFPTFSPSLLPFNLTPLPSVYQVLMFISFTFIPLLIIRTLIANALFIIKFIILFAFLQRRNCNGTCRAAGSLSQDAPFAVAIGACILSSLVLPVSIDPDEDTGDSPMDSTDARFAVMGILSFIPYFNWMVICKYLLILSFALVFLYLLRKEDYWNCFNLLFPLLELGFRLAWYWEAALRCICACLLDSLPKVYTHFHILIKLLEKIKWLVKEKEKSIYESKMMSHSFISKYIMGLTIVFNEKLLRQLWLWYICNIY